MWPVVPVGFLCVARFFFLFPRHIFLLFPSPLFFTISPNFLLLVSLSTPADPSSPPFFSSTYPTFPPYPTVFCLFRQIPTQHLPASPPPPHPPCTSPCLNKYSNLRASIHNWSMIPSPFQLSLLWRCAPHMAVSLYALILGSGDARCDTPLVLLPRVFGPGCLVALRLTWSRGSTSVPCFSFFFCVCSSPFFFPHFLLVFLPCTFYLRGVWITLFPAPQELF